MTCRSSDPTVPFIYQTNYLSAYSPLISPNDLGFPPGGAYQSSGLDLCWFNDTPFGLRVVINDTVDIGPFQVATTTDGLNWSSHLPGVNEPLGFGISHPVWQTFLGWSQDPGHDTLIPLSITDDGVTWTLDTLPNNMWVNWLPYQQSIVITQSGYLTIGGNGHIFSRGHSLIDTWSEATTPSDAIIGLVSLHPY
jgi:hypothetical protein